MNTDKSAVFGKALLIAMMCVAMAACSKKVKEAPPADTGPSTGAQTAPSTASTGSAEITPTVTAPIRHRRGAVRMPTRLSQPLLRLRLKLYRLMQQHRL